MSVLGVSEHEVLGLPDGALGEHERTGESWAARLLATVRPDTILTFGADGMTYHPDHIAVHRWVTRAWRVHGCRSRLLYATPTVEHLARFGALYEQWGMYMSDQRPAGVPTAELALHVTLQGPQLDRKLTALRAMATQTSTLVEAMDIDVYAAQVCEEAFVEARPAPPLVA
jgi:LmbE family N-acetylglucosaminyl deacetylase